MAGKAATQRKKGGGVGETIRFVLTFLLIAAVLRSFIVAPFMIPSGSMLPRLMIGDYLFVAKWPYGYSRYSIPYGAVPFDGRIAGGQPKRGDVIVFRHPATHEDWVKRLIGLPGDRIQVRAGELILNGKPVPRVRIADWMMPVTANSPCRFQGRIIKPERSQGGAWCRYPRYRETLPGGPSYDLLDQGETVGDDTKVYTVPAGHYFMMGDNRDDSLDSRFTLEEQGVGMLPAENLVGRVLITFFSTDGSASWLKPWTWFSAARWDRVGLTG